MADIIPLSKIKISDDRQRRVFKPEAIAELAESITNNELLHAIVVDSDYNLIAGERRIRALKLLFSMGATVKYNGSIIPRDHVPCTSIADTSEDKVHEAELIENLHRVNLTVQEEADAIAKLHRLRLKQNPSHTISDTTRELIGQLDKKDEPASAISGWARNKVSESLLISEYSSDPRVAQAKSRKQAVSAVEKIKREEHAKKVAAEFQEKPTTTSRHNIHHCGAEDLLVSLPDESIDLFLTDPPYGIDAQNFGNQTSLTHKYDDSYGTWVKLMTIIADEMHRTAKPNAHAYLFCDYSRFEYLSEIFQMADWQVWPKPLIWYKGASAGMLPRPDHGPRYTYETILFANKGTRPVELRGKPDVLLYPRKKLTRHAAEKPPALYLDLMQRSMKPGDTVCDPFMGSGPVIPAANSMPAKVIACDIEETFYGMALQRVEEVVEDAPEAVDDVDLTSLFQGE